MRAVTGRISTAVVSSDGLRPGHARAPSAPFGGTVRTVRGRRPALPDRQATIRPGPTSFPQAHTGRRTEKIVRRHYSGADGPRGDDQLTQRAGQEITTTRERMTCGR
ncbi:hypothetical protein Stube_42050 [Streptomyces tubercidicus]|uniref:Uncharacterized protein n=1 Tax=Streptomyces tubercidicus TaxID=47759 RepID=A0A640UVY1_9ACTN|nr:hypothetical protein Stube_42050 [Streptomyces tubercidicus]